MSTLSIPRRYRILITITCVLAILIVIYLFRIQIVSPIVVANAAEETELETITYTSSLPAARGNIYDRSGVPLISNSQVYSLRINKGLWDNEKQNDVILSLISLMRECRTSYIDTLPISNPPFAYTISYGSAISVRTSFDSYVESKGWDVEDKAANIIELMCKEYGVTSEYSNAEKRLIVGVRYEMDKCGFSVLTPYTFAQNVGMDLITEIKEASYDFKGVEIVADSIREYKTIYAAHILGRTGKIFKEEYEELASQGYGMNATVGKDGVEKAFESYLRGIDGSKKQTVDKYGNTVDIISASEPKAGNNVILTIDLDIQIAAEKALANRIAEIKELSITDPEKYPEDVAGGAAIMIKVDTGEILAMASYPTYKLESFSEDYSSLLEDEQTPMVNRVIGGTYPVGSVFKMVTAVAALEEGVINPEDTITDEGIYTKYTTFRPQCWIYRQHGTTHGTLNVSMALRDSCNYFFYTVADTMGIVTLDKWTSLFGLGEKTGIEIAGEVSGQRANAESKAKSTSIQWTAGDTLTAAIGQSYSLFTPIQLCAYLSAVCNGGYYYKPHLLKEVTTYDYSSVIVDTQPDLIRTIPMSESTYKAVMEGMLDAAENGTAAAVFEDYPMQVGGKTGSAQVSNGTSNGVFAAFAPFENPEIAVVVIVEHGGSGSNIGIIAREIMDAYFKTNNKSETASIANGLN